MGLIFDILTWTPMGHPSGDISTFGDSHNWH